MWPFKKCLHDWGVLSEQHFEAKWNWEEMAKRASNMKMDHDLTLKMFRDTKVTIVSCNKCGAIREFVNRG